MKYQVRTSLPLANTQFNVDDDKKKHEKKKRQEKRKAKRKEIATEAIGGKGNNTPAPRKTYTMQDLTPEQRKKIDSINLSPSAKQKAINSFAKLN